MNVDAVFANLPIQIVVAIFEAGEQRDSALEAWELSLRDGGETTIFECRDAGVLRKTLSKGIGLKCTDTASQTRSRLN